MNNSHSPHSAWLFRLAIDKGFRRKNLAQKLVKTVQNYCKRNGYLDLQLVVSECQENARQLFANCGLVL